MKTHLIAYIGLKLPYWTLISIWILISYIGFKLLILDLNHLN